MADSFTAVVALLFFLRPLTSEYQLPRRRCSINLRVEYRNRQPITYIDYFRVVRIPAFHSILSQINFVSPREPNNPVANIRVKNKFIPMNIQFVANEILRRSSRSFRCLKILLNFAQAFAALKSDPLLSSYARVHAVCPTSGRELFNFRSRQAPRTLQTSRSPAVSAGLRVAETTRDRRP